MLLVASFVLHHASWLGRLAPGRSGQNLIEYGMLAALIALIAIGAVTAVGGSINAVLWEPAAARF